MMISHQFWHNKRVLITGHSGFKGSWLSLWLHRLGAINTGVSLPPDTSPNLFDKANILDTATTRFCDIRVSESLSPIVKKTDPEIVFHLAAQPLVRKSYSQPLETIATNVMGTTHLLDALRNLKSVRVVIVVTTDKVYHNKDWPYPYRENDGLGGHDPYSASKAATEIITASYRDSFLSDQGIAVATARAGNVIGGGDWAQDRLIPDAVRAWTTGKPLVIRMPNAIRPWQHVLEPLAGYLLLAERLWATPSLAGAYNFGPETSDALTVRDVVETARRCFGTGEVIWDTDGATLKESGYLALEIAKASKILGIKPIWRTVDSIQKTMNWYRRVMQGENARLLCEKEIADYEASL